MASLLHHLCLQRGQKGISLMSAGKFSSCVSNENYHPKKICNKCLRFFSGKPSLSLFQKVPSVISSIPFGGLVCPVIRLNLFVSDAHLSAFRD